MKLAKRKAPAAIFQQTDIFGNLVELSPETWTYHIITGHPEMAGYESIVQQAIKDPFQVCESTQYDSGAVFFSAPGVGPSVEVIRAIVLYQDWSYLKGASTGIVATAYPIDIVKYGHPKIGKSIYRKGKR